VLAPDVHSTAAADPLTFRLVRLPAMLLAAAAHVQCNLASSAVLSLQVAHFAHSCSNMAPWARYFWAAALEPGDVTVLTPPAQAVLCALPLTLLMHCTTGTPPLLTPACRWPGA
jgi:hypothetical protein